MRKSRRSLIHDAREQAELFARSGQLSRAPRVSFWTKAHADYRPEENKIFVSAGFLRGLSPVLRRAAIAVLVGWTTVAKESEGFAVRGRDFALNKCGITEKQLEDLACAWSAFRRAARPA